MVVSKKQMCNLRFIYESTVLQLIVCVSLAKCPQDAVHCNTSNAADCNHKKIDTLVAFGLNTSIGVLTKWP